MVQTGNCCGVGLEHFVVSALNIALKVVAYGVCDVNGRVDCVIYFEVVNTKLGVGREVVNALESV